MKPSGFQPSFITPAGGVRWGKALDDFRINRLSVQRTSPKAMRSKTGIQPSALTMRLECALRHRAKFAGKTLPENIWPL